MSHLHLEFSKANKCHVFSCFLKIFYIFSHRYGFLDTLILKFKPKGLHLKKAFFFIPNLDKPEPKRLFI